MKVRNFNSNCEPVPYLQGRIMLRGLNGVLVYLLFLLLCPPVSPSLAGTLDHAEKQLSLFALSRPGAGEILSGAEELRGYLLQAFSGEFTSVPLAWDNREPNDNAYAEHKPNIPAKVIHIRVSSTLGILDQVACLFYESVNAQNENAFAALTEKAHEGLLSKTEFIHGILRLEHNSLKRTRTFLARQQPFAGQDLSQTVFLKKMEGTPEEFKAFIEYLHTIKRKEYDVFQHYSDFYDFVIPPTKRWKARQRALAEQQLQKPAPMKSTDSESSSQQDAGEEE